MRLYEENLNKSAYVYFLFTIATFVSSRLSFFGAVMVLAEMEHARELILAILHRT